MRLPAAPFLSQEYPQDCFTMCCLTMAEDLIDVSGAPTLDLQVTLYPLVALKQAHREHCFSSQLCQSLTINLVIIAQASTWVADS